MSEAFFGIAPSTTLSAIVNIETYMDEPATVKSPSGGGHYLIPLTSGRQRVMASGYTREDGRIDAQLVFSVESRADLDDFMYGIFGGWTVPSVQRAFSLMDETGHYSPFLGYISKPVFGAYYGVRSEVTFPIRGLELQTLTKTANYTMASTDHLIYGDTTAGSITIALLAVASLVPNVAYSAQKVASANSLILDPNGSEQIQGASTYTLTANHSRVDYFTDGAALYIIDPS